jgi:hypothetical protein
MKQIKSWKELDRAILSKIAEAMSEVGKDMVEEVQKSIRDEVYIYHPKEYQTTGDLHDSVYSKSPDIKNKNVEIVIKHDTDKINSRQPNQHYSVVEDYDPSDVSDWIPYLVHEGQSGKIFGDGFWTKPRRYMDKTVEDLRNNKKHVKRLVEHLNSVGVKAKEG